MRPSSLSWAAASTLVALAAAPAFAQQQPQPNPCFRWSGQMAIANKAGASTNGTSTASTLWYQGGQAKLSSDQDSNWWTNALVSLPLDESWQTGTPPLTLVEPDSGDPISPPAVSLGAMWASADGNSLYQWGGQWSDNPDVPPPAARTWRYDIQAGEWEVVQTQGDEVGNVAEGQPAIVPGQGTDGDNVAYYSHGHQDDHTTEGWSNQIARIYLNSMIQFDLGSRTMRNITSYSSNAQTSNSSTPQTNPLSRADGSLTYVPNLGTDNKGVLVSIGGATQTQYVEDGSVLDVYDIGAAGWTRQSTLGARVGSRINHCAVRGSAKVHGQQVHHIIVYGGQRINQTDRDSDLYILTIQDNTYTWTDVGTLPGAPTGRAGHQCALSGNQLVVVGGLTRDDVLCEQPGIFVLNTSSFEWQSEYRPNSVFSTPALVANLTGGIGTGFSTSGAGSATGGDGTNDPDTSGATDGSSSGPEGDVSGGTRSDGSGGDGTNAGAIAGGVVGGIVGLALLALLAFLLMRRRRRQREAEDSEKRALAGAAVAGRSNSGSSSSGRGRFVHEKGFARESFSSGAFPPYGWDRRGSGSVQHVGPASDDVEQETAGMETFISTGLAPKRELRVVNADN
ncbi:hypothetical protein Rhopal_006564-T1 [Rhodotorula paludigena]|uniref:Epidermal growth factor receptor-like transmembrane-juxtamembrane segment domain-containing protein n=1 Tax=Rhodotorula paludigena TaxID=86838 RepID=A0AAV5GW14_9BASI|nr:hypothetical protein Rhopal_006564-T1 [Rhodotorula paludigena]